MSKEILVNTTDYETRVAIIEDGKLVEMFSEKTDAERMVGNIYKGKIKTVLPGMQAAFIDIGNERAAYLHSSDVGKEYDDSDELDEEAPAEIIRKTRRQGIETVLKKNQEVLIQVIKEPISTKGPRVTTEISIPGRYLVLVPDDDHIRVSKRISNWAERKRLRKAATPCRPEGFGLIIRTEAEGKNESELRADVKRLLKLWSKLKKKADTATPPAVIHKESDLIISMIRDLFTMDVDRIVCDDRSDYKQVVSFARSVAPKLKERIVLYKDPLPLFDEYDLEPEIEKMLDRKVWIKKGAYLVIDQTEAMVTIDVNTGRFVGSKDQETTIFLTNIEAAREAARQIRLRDIGGLIIVDFIDMYRMDNRRKLFEEFKKCFETDRAKRAISTVTEFGIIEMTRERIRQSHMHALSDPCPNCDGVGRVLSRDTMTTKIERWFIRAKAHKEFTKFNLAINPILSESMAENGINRIERMMKIHKFAINIIRDTTIPLQEFKVFNAGNNEEITDMYKV